ncbi:MAG TPA: histidine kinase [Streptosporangiaceae bacterium]|nr:histidine kinase [Streptosporangiaceae bacterium]
MVLLSAAGQGATDQEADGPWAARSRRVLISLVLGFLLLAPAFKIAVHGPHNGLQWFQLTGAVALAAVVIPGVLSAQPAERRQTQWARLVVISSLALALFVVGGPNWLAMVAVAAAVSGRFTRNPVPVIVTVLAFMLTGLILASVNHYESGNVVSVLLIAPLAALFAYSAAGRAETLNRLRRTRAELARAAVAEERLRIARDLHDLLGHSLSLITLKAELAGRVLTADPDRAAKEISELESVARQSLADVRGAVAGFRQPDLAGELVAARQLLDAAGIAAKIGSAESTALPREVDSALAWAVREGATNVVRHSTATQVSITVTVEQAAAVAEIWDNGEPVPGDKTGPDDDRPLRAASPGPAAATTGPDGRAALVLPRPSFAGSGLAGLTERVRSLGGEIAAGAVSGHGFLLRVAIPVAAQA